MKPGDQIQYFDKAGMNHRALVLDVHGAGARPVVTLVAIIGGKNCTFRNIPHREGVLVLQPPRKVWSKGNPDDPNPAKRPRVIAVVEGEHKRTPGKAFWFE